MVLFKYLFIDNKFIHTVYYIAYKFIHMVLYIVYYLNNR